MSKTYIVYKRTSPSGNAYVGYTSGDLMERWKGRIQEVKNTTLPLKYAIDKYGTDTWTHEILFTTTILQEALDKEIELIAEFGYYNIAKGGQGGDTGRNHEQWKKDKQAKSLSLHWKNLPQEEKDRRIKKNVEARINNGTMGANNPKYGNEHGQWSGNWIVNHIAYTTLEEAATRTGLNQSTILSYCIWDVDHTFKRGSKYIKKGTTPRQNGYYKETT